MQAASSLIHVYQPITINHIDHVSHIIEKIFFKNDFLNEGPFFLNKDDIHIWLIEPPCHADYNLFSVLSVEEKNRANLFFSDHQKIFFSYCHSYLRSLIALYNHCDPSEVKFIRSPNGKPYLIRKNQNLNFNISHSGEAVIICLARDFEVGIDLERIDHSLDWRELTQDVLTTNEQYIIMNYDIREQIRIFYAIWTLKEAYLKGTGEGIASLLKNIEFIGPFFQEQEFVKACHAFDQDQGWFLKSLGTLPNYSAAIAINSEPKLIKLFHVNLTLTKHRAGSKNIEAA